MREIKESKENGTSPYIYKVHVTLTVAEFVEKYKDANNVKEIGSFDESAIESVCGRVMSIRTAGQTLTFLGLEEAGTII